MILLTGASGFIGSHLLDSLIEIYGSNNIIALTSKPITKCRFLIHNNYTFKKQYFTEAGYENIDTIIHAGAFIPKIAGESNNIEKCTSNIHSTFSLLSSEFPQLKKFIFLSTTDVYGNSPLITEESTTNNISLYGSSKLYCEKLISAWATERKITHQILRVGHVYGPGEEYFQKIIPVTMQRILKGEPVQIFDEGKSIRSFIFISDVIESIINSIHLTSYAGEINIAGDEQITIKDLIKKIISISNLPVKIEKVNANAQARDFIFNNKKMKELLHHPKIKLNQGLLNEWLYMQKMLQ